MNLVKVFLPDDQKKWVPMIGYIVGHTQDHRTLFFPAPRAEHQQVAATENGRTTLTLQGIIVLDEMTGIYDCSGFVDKNGGYIYDQDIIIADGKCFLINKSLARTRWEIVALSPKMEPIDKPVALYKVGSSLQKKATVFAHNRYHVSQRSTR